MAEWNISISGDVEPEICAYGKIHPREVASVMVNLDRVMQQLGQGKRIGGFQFGFFRPEGNGVYRIGQTGVKNAKETRLCICPDETTHVVRVLAIGDKDSQQRDIRRAKSRL